MAENFSNLERDADIKVHEAYRFLYRMNYLKGKLKNQSHKRSKNNKRLRYKFHQDNERSAHWKLEVIDEYNWSR